MKYAFTLIILAFLLAGCCPTQKQEIDWKLPSDPMSRVVNDINANNSKIPTLWAHHYYEADVVDEKKQSHHVSGDGALLYVTPGNMRLIGTAAAVGTVFDIGSNAKTFWLKLAPEAGDTMWWGNYENFAQMNPDQARIPIRPDMVLDVLGIATLNTNFNEMPVPTMRYNAAAKAYVFIWNGRLPNRWVALREVWYERESKRPYLVLLYDMNGRVVLQAELKKFRQVQVAGTPRDQWPWMPGDYRLFFPESGSLLRFTLDDAALTHQDPDGPVIPNPKSFRMPSIENADVTHVIEIGGETNHPTQEKQPSQ